MWTRLTSRMFIYIVLTYNIITTKQTVKLKTINQNLDHFSERNVTFKMFFLENEQYFKGSGPILLYIGGEQPIKKWIVKNSAMVKLAEETRGMLFALEHRYFGRSTPDLPEVGTKGLKYLTVAQALADVKNFVETVKNDVRFAKSKVIAVGMSYSGVLASWARQKYPDLIDAAWASSAPIQTTLDFHQAYELVGKLYKTIGGNSCYRNIVRLFDYEEELFRKNRTDVVKRENNICHDVDLDNEMSKHIFFHVLTAHFMQSLTFKSIKRICKEISDFETAKTGFHFIGCEFKKRSIEAGVNDRYRIINKTTIYHSVNKICKDRYTYDCDSKAFKYNVGSNPAWEWLACNELGYFTSTNSGNQPFGTNNPLEYFIKRCKYLGKEFSEDYIRNGIETTNEMYGGLEPNVTKIVYVNGELDFWSSLGVTRNLNEMTSVVIINEGGHGDDFLYLKRNRNVSEIVLARKRIFRTIKEWIK